MEKKSETVSVRLKPSQNTLWRRVDWPVAITWGVIAAVEFCIIYGAASYVMGAIR
jgi:hypothetical protein